MLRRVFTFAMSNPGKANVKKRPGSRNKRHHSSYKNYDSQGSKQKENAESSHSNASSVSWPSEKHKCLILFHDGNKLLPSSFSDILKPFGSVSKLRSVVLHRNVMTVCEMSSSAEAEMAWRELSKKKPDGVARIIPDRQHMTIETYSPYWDSEETKNSIDSGELLTGPLRINARMFHHAFISDGNNPDVLIDSVIARNRALPGDIVAVKLRDACEWISEGNIDVSESEELVSTVLPAEAQSGANDTDRKLVKTGDVVAVVERRHNRLCVGTLVEKRGDKVLLRPVDNCLPRLLIPASQCPVEFLKRQSDFDDKLFLASIDSWDEGSTLASGVLRQFIGDKGEIESETTRILLESDVDYSEFPATVEDSLPTEWEIPPEEYKARRDLCSECVFTIDPSTARDLDDALHCKKLHDDLYEVGVHIADVSYFVKPETEVDSIAAKRCTSVYLVQRVIPMLPSMLCEQLCSLNPGKDRLTYSVIWTITGKGKIVDEWCGRTVINSCVKLSYDHAQSLIESSNKEYFEKEGFPEVGGGHQLKTVRNKILHLHQIAQSLRRSRFENGALRLDQIKLAYTLNDDTGLPNSCFTYRYKSSNELIEEFMLLANISIAHRLKDALPQHAFLRCHPEPKPDMLNKIALYCSKHGCNMDVGSSKTLASSLREATNSKDLPENCSLGLQMLAIKPQELAIYFCAGCVDDEEKYRHYALSVPVYTHFTSPIRRYADIVVHRQLSIALGDMSCQYSTNLSPEELEKQAKACNIRKSQAKKVQDLGVQLFFYALVKAVGSIEDKAIVIYVYDHAFDILPLRYGQVYRVYLDNLPIVGSKYAKASSTLQLLWPCDGTDRYKRNEWEIKLAKEGKLKMPQYSGTMTQTIGVFSTVDVVMEAPGKEVKIKTYIKRTSDSNA